MTKSWLIASNNPGKSRDLAQYLAYYGIVAQPYYEVAPRLDFPAETTTSYIENAKAKAKFAAQQLQQPVIADDSGIEIPAQPTAYGVTTARDLGQTTSGFDRNQALITTMAGVPDDQRQAVMRATLAAAWPDGRVVTTQAMIQGYLAHHQIGRYSGGFDRLFWLPHFGRTLAELPDIWRVPLTHRGHAAAQLQAQLLGQKG